MNWKTETRKLKDLKPYKFNPRILTEKQHKDLKRSLKKFGLVEIPAIMPSGKIIAGHQRIKILLEEKGEDFNIPVRVCEKELNEKDFKEYLIRSNANTGDWDFDSLANSFEKDDLEDWGLNINFDNAELPKDIGTIDASFEVVCECVNEAEQRELFERFSKEGIKCRLLTL